MGSLSLSVGVQSRYAEGHYCAGGLQIKKEKRVVLFFQDFFTGKVSWINMDPATHVSPPDPLEVAAGPSSSPLNSESLSAVLETFFLSRVELAGQGQGARKRPPPTPISSETSESEPIPAVAGTSSGGL